MNNNNNSIVVYGGFDDIRSSDIRFLHESSRSGFLHVLLWSDKLIREVTGSEPKFPEDERLYFLESLRFVHKVILVNKPLESLDFSSIIDKPPFALFIRQANESSTIKTLCENENIELRILQNEDFDGFPEIIGTNPKENHNKKVIVTGCFDWFHSGHIRFFEEVSEMGDLYVVVGNDANVRALKGQDHPMFSEQERRYIVQSIRFVKQAYVSTGQGWLDAEPEIRKIKPDIYAVNEDGDRPEKQKYCQENGIEYVVLKRLPKAGLPRRQSTIMRGF